MQPTILDNFFRILVEEQERGIRSQSTVFNNQKGEQV